MLLNGYLNGGTRDLWWNGRGEDGQAVPAGVYWIRFKAAGETAAARLVLIP